MDVVYEVRVYSVLGNREVRKHWKSDYDEACHIARSSLHKGHAVVELSPDRFVTKFMPSQGSMRAQVIRHEVT